MAEKTPSALRRFRTTDELWRKFGDAVERSSDPEADMSKVLRSFVRWYVGEPGAKMPERPEPEEK
ncbi:hypothetical protein DFP74_5761 [Nocardiopsis sp. Huas11]|nr:hypothetical protein DFP74_5761 [Nocardiopsis sp. Huas11]